MVPSGSKIRVYIDGFNVYFSMKDQGWRKYYWLDNWGLSIKLLQKAKSLGFVSKGATIDSVRYFTSRIGDTGRQKQKAARQNAYLEAIEINSKQRNANLSISYGQYQLKPYNCDHCKKTSKYPIEKMTDVNLATDLLVDGFYDNFDIAIVVSGDSDLKRPVGAIKELFSDKKVIMAFPPDRWSKQLASEAYRYIFIEERQFKQSQLPSEIKRDDGYIIKRPALWS